MTRECHYCEHHEWELGEPDCGYPDTLYCGLEHNNATLDYAMHCPDYSAIPAGNCGFCGDLIPGDLSDVKHWCDEPFADQPSPACSVECVIASTAKVERQLREDEQAAQEIAEMMREEQQTCPHGNDPVECNTCMEYGDFRADCAKEDRHFGRIKGRD